MDHPAGVKASRRHFLLGGASLLAGDAFARARIRHPLPPRRRLRMQAKTPSFPPMSKWSTFSRAYGQKGEIVKT